jgi:hypothetical protein
MVYDIFDSKLHTGNYASYTVVTQPRGGKGGPWVRNMFLGGSELEKFENHYCNSSRRANFGTKYLNFSSSNKQAIIKCESVKIKKEEAIRFSSTEANACQNWGGGGNTRYPRLCRHLEFEGRRET